jgi:hypothetical protein
VEGDEEERVEARPGEAQRLYGKDGIVRHGYCLMGNDRPSHGTRTGQ